MKKLFLALVFVPVLAFGISFEASDNISGQGDSTYVNVTGDTMTGALTVNAVLTASSASVTNQFSIDGSTFNCVSGECGLQTAPETGNAMTIGGATLAKGSLKSNTSVEALVGLAVPQRVYINSANDANVPTIYANSSGKLTINSIAGQNLALNTDNGEGVIIGSTLTVTGNAFSVGDSNNFVLKASSVGINMIPAGTALEIASMGAGVTNTRYGANASGASFNFQKSRGNIISSHSVVADADVLGTFAFRGSDGSAFYNAGSFKFEADGAWDATNHPGRFVVTTGITQAQGLVERMRITSTGNVGIGTTSPDNKLHISSGTVTIDGTGAPTVGYGLCLATGGKLGHCTTVLAADGTCTCTTP